MNLLELLGVHWLQQHLMAPTADLPAICADTAKYTSDGTQVSPEAMRAANLALIDYVTGRIARQALPHGIGATVQQVLTPGVGEQQSGPTLPQDNFNL